MSTLDRIDLLYETSKMPYCVCDLLVNVIEYWNFSDSNVDIKAKILESPDEISLSYNDIYLIYHSKYPKCSNNPVVEVANPYVEMEFAFIELEALFTVIDEFKKFGKANTAIPLLSGAPSDRYDFFSSKSYW